MSTKEGGRKGKPVTDGIRSKKKKKKTSSGYLNTKIWRNVAKETVGNFKNMNSLAS